MSHTSRDVENHFRKETNSRPVEVQASQRGFKMRFFKWVVARSIFHKVASVEIIDDFSLSLVQLCSSLYYVNACVTYVRTRSNRDTYLSLTMSLVKVSKRGQSSRQAVHSQRNQYLPARVLCRSCTLCFVNIGP